jgi:hypothetical protein
MTVFPALDLIDVSSSVSAYVRPYIEHKVVKIGKKTPPLEWPLNDPKALASIRRGIKQMREGDLRDLGSFEQYADD